MIKIAIAGLGTVGSSVINYLEKNNNYLSKNINNQIKIVGICASNIKKSRSFDINKYVWFDDPVDMIKKTSPNIFIELIGTEKGISYDSIKYAIEHNVHVISANKALIANYGNELFPLAEKNNINFLFEASVAGGIPVIKIIKESLLGNNITKISGILNGSTNYILSNMTNNELEYKVAFDNAQNEGYLEANPDFDINGIDSAHKLSILSSLCFKNKLTKFDSIYCEGISKINKIDIKYAKQLNFVIKLLSVAEIIENKLIQYVKPIMIDKNLQLAKVDGVLNGIEITSNELGKIFFQGNGAGGPATASSVISDIVQISKNNIQPSLGMSFDNLKKSDNLSIVDPLKHYNSYYIRLNVKDQKGVLADITSHLKNHNISIETLIQNPKDEEFQDDFIPLVFITHKTYFYNIKNSINKIISLENINNEPVVIQIDKV